LRDKLPGEEAQYRMAPLHRQRLEIETLKVEQYRPSAVMILLCEDEKDKIFIPLTERMAYNGAHSGQISLPGGKADEKDTDLKQTAIRECFEEIGIKEIEVLGPLTKLFIPVSSFLVQPFIGICTIKNPPIKVQEREVKSLLKLYLDELTDENLIQKGSIDVFTNLKIEAPWFNVGGHKVWGATAMILSELKELLKKSV
jgi:8-oxo-dGTP pyrophosphatase MutT (NUDIX family)